MRPLFFTVLILALFLIGCSQVLVKDDIPAKSAELQLLLELPDLGIAPELTNTVWFNTPSPLHLADLRGKVVIIEMWTFGCINCRNVIPSLTEWHEKYAEEGLVIIGNHFPEFSFEADTDNLKNAIMDLNIPYAVAQDYQGETWKAY